MQSRSKPVLAAKQRSWRLRNREHYNAWRRDYKLRRRAHLLDQQRAWRARNRESINAYQRQYRKLHPKKRTDKRPQSVKNAKLREWRERNREHYVANRREYERRYRQEKRLWRALDEMAQRSNIGELVLFDLE